MPGLALKKEEGLIPQALKTPPLEASSRKKVIVISGPTAVGKTELSLLIAKAIGGEIISADSMQVYRGMDIGTAKATLEERLKIPHHLIDSREIEESYNVAEFCDEAWSAIREIHDKGAVPIVVGGTGFYIHALIYGSPAGPSSNAKVREKLEEEMRLHGPELLYDRLQKIDPVYAATITFRDRHKIIRALEIITLSQKRVSDLKSDASHIAEQYDFRCWFLYYPKEVLYERIEARCEQMLKEGFLAEVERLKQEGLTKNTTACQAIGYRQCLDYLETQKTKDDWEHFIQAFKRSSRRYAKRQFTWFRKEPLFRWINLSEVVKETCVEYIIQDFEHK